jgi:branched-chain amino acid transport system substrate-binding protein
MAVDELNAKGGINGNKIELVVEDTKSTAVGSISAIQKLVSIDNVSTILGPTWLDVYPGAQGTVTGKNVVMISPDAGAEAVSIPSAYKNVFSLWYRSQPKAELFAKYLQNAGIKRLDIIVQNDAYYTDLSNRIETESKKLGIEVVRKELINGGDADFRTLITKIKSDNADMVFAALYDQKAIDAFFKNRSQLYPDMKLSSDEFGQDYVDNPDFVQLVNNMSFFSATRQDDLFETRFKERYNEVPKFGASNSYDTIMILAQALEKDPEHLSNYISKTEFNTVTFGKMRFDDIHGATTKNSTYVMKQVVDGTVTVLK